MEIEVQSAEMKVGQIFTVQQVLSTLNASMSDEVGRLIQYSNLI